MQNSGGIQKENKVQSLSQQFHIQLGGKREELLENTKSYQTPNYKTLLFPHVHRFVISHVVQFEIMFYMMTFQCTILFCLL